MNILRGKALVRILGIESSCDETAAAVVENGRRVLSDAISSQIEIHRRFGGVVPEVASRNHTLAIDAVIDEALIVAGIAAADIDAVAVTYGAGLLGALLVGVSAAKAFAYALNKPLIKVNHIEAHIAAAYPAFPDLQPPFLALVASGGHTQLIDVQGYNTHTVLGGTADDAVGEAFDKVARVLGLPYPGGPEIDKLSKTGKADIAFYKHKPRVNPDFSLSYSGLKTAVVNYINTLKMRGASVPTADIAASMTAAALDILIETAMLAARRQRRDTLVLAGGVAANSYLRDALSAACQQNGIRLCVPPHRLCTDNAVMVAARGFYSLQAGVNLADLTLNAVSTLTAGDV